MPDFKGQLASMGRKARESTGCEEITVVADRGYSNGDGVLAYNMKRMINIFGARPLMQAIVA